MAHAPSAIAIAYNPMTYKLSVTITHPVDNPAVHYIRGVHVKLNGDVISDPDYKSQPSKDTFTYTYDVAAHPGDTFWVIATCVNGQSLETHYDVQKPLTPVFLEEPPRRETAVPPPAATTLPAPTTYAATGLLPLLGIPAVLILFRK